MKFQDNSRNIKKPATGKRKKILSALRETEYLLSIPGMRESIIEGIKAPNDEILSKEEFLAEIEKTADL